jgi:hypothetical protein
MLKARLLENRRQKAAMIKSMAVAGATAPEAARETTSFATI